MPTPARHTPNAELTPALITATQPHRPHEGYRWWGQVLDARRPLGAAEKRQLLADLGTPGMTRDLIMASTAGGRAVDVEDLAMFAAVLQGTSLIRPNWARMDRAERILANLLGEAPVGHRAPTSTFLGWIAWYKGDQKAAASLFVRALDDAPGHRLAGLLAQFPQRGLAPAVCSNPATAYPARSASEVDYGISAAAPTLALDGPR